MFLFLLSFLISAALSARHSSVYLLDFCDLRFIPIIAFIVIYAKSIKINQYWFPSLILLGCLYGWGTFKSFHEANQNSCQKLATYTLELPSLTVYRCGNNHSIYSSSGSGDRVNIVGCEGDSCVLNSLLSDIYSSKAEFFRRVIRLKIESIIEDVVPQKLKFFYYGLLLPGEVYGFQWIDLFKNLGIYHILVLSGFHIMLLIRLTEYVFQGIPHLLYSVGLFNFTFYMRARLFCKFIQFISISLFCFIVGFPVPCQRAYSSYLARLCGDVVGLKLKPTHRILVGLCFHIWIFPWRALDASFWLSWVIYSVFFVRWSFPSEKYSGLFSVIFRQLLITIILLLFFERVPVVGLFVNIIFSMFLNLFVYSIMASFILLSFDLPNGLLSLQVSVLDFILDNTDDFTLSLGLNHALSWLYISCVFALLVPSLLKGKMNSK